MDSIMYYTLYVFHSLETTHSDYKHVLKCRDAINTLISPWRVIDGELVLEEQDYYIELDRLLNEQDWEEHLAKKVWCTWQIGQGLHFAIALHKGGVS